MTIYDIAREAGVSASTVSRVLNDKKGVNPTTRAKIQQLLKKYHFEPNASAQGLIKQSSRLIGIMMSDIRTAHHAEGAYFVEQQLQSYGYSCIIVNSGFSDASRENGFRLLASRQAEAIVLIGSTFQSDSVKKNIQKYLPHTPVIIENGFLDLPNVYSVLADEENGVAECLRLLYHRGRRHPCYINLSDTPSNWLKLQGFLSVWHAHNPDSTQAPPVFHLHQQEESEWDCCYRSIPQIMADHPETDAMIFSTDLLANAGLFALLDKGYSIPGDIAIMGIDNSAHSRQCHPRLSVLDNRLQELSITCSNILIQLLNNQPVPHKIMVLSNIIQREST